MTEARVLVDTIVSYIERGGRLGSEDMNFLMRNVHKIDCDELISARDYRGLRDIAVLVKLCSQEKCHRCGSVHKRYEGTPL